MKKILSLFLAISVLTGLVFAQSTVNPMALPKLTQWVNDFSQVLSTSQFNEINTIAKSYEAQTSNQLVTVLFPNREGNELIDIGMKIFKDNGIGQKDKNNGLLLLISTQEKKIRIIVGYGLEGVYPDLMASQVIENDVRPLVNSGDFAGAVKAFYDKSISILSGEIPEGYSTTTSSSDKSDNFPYVGVIIGFFVGLALKSFLKGKYKKLKKPLKRTIGIGLSAIFLILFLGGIYFVGTFLVAFAFGLLFAIAGFLPGRFGGGMFGGGGGFGGGGFGGGGGGSGGGGAGD